jgi:hypothetical protein
MRKYNTATVAATHIGIPIIKRAVVDYAVSADWTPASGDVRVSKDGGAWANIATLPTASSAGGNGSAAIWVFQLSAAELQCKTLDVVISDAATKAIEDQFFKVETFGDASAMYPSDPSANNIDAETRFLRASQGIVYGTVGSGTNSTTQVSISGGSGACSPAPTVTDQFKGRVLIFADDTTTAALRGQGGPVNGNTTTAITLAAGDALTTAPANGDIFTIT